MRKQFDFLKDYLFLRCFSEKEYLDSFASGKCIYMNSVQKFWKITNEFQGDPSECCVVSPNSDIKWSCWEGNGKPEKKLFDMADFRISIQGFLYCMFTIPKSFFRVENGNLLYDRENVICQDFIAALNQYRAGTATGCAYICVFDAFQFMNRVREHFDANGLNFRCGWIAYKDEDAVAKVQYMNDQQIEKIVFTKPEKYKYQHEFRIFVSSSTQENEYLQLTDIPIEDIIFLRTTMIQDWRN